MLMQRTWKGWRDQRIFEETALPLIVGPNKPQNKNTIDPNKKHMPWFHVARYAWPTTAVPITPWHRFTSNKYSTSMIMTHDTTQKNVGKETCLNQNVAVVKSKYTKKTI